MPHFNPHPRKGSDRPVCPGRMPMADFNPHPRKGSDEAGYTGGQHGGISIHTPARGVTLSIRPRFHFPHISIHTPARGVTGNVSISDSFEEISIHTPARGVTSTWTARFSHLCYFNPHPRKGSDHLIRQMLLFPSISIHTPARGVTQDCLCVLVYRPGFQSTPPQGE